MSSQVGSGTVAIFPTFKGFRSDVTKETAAAGAEGGGRFDSEFKKSTKATGTSAGKAFKTQFDSATQGLAATAVKSLTREVAQASAQVSTARLKEQDAAGKVRVAEAQLADARSKYAGDSAQVVRAEERLATSSRALENVQSTVKNATERLSNSQKELAGATEAAARAAGGQQRTFRQAASGFFQAGQSSASSFVTGFQTSVAASFAGNLLADLARAAGQAAVEGLQKGVDYAVKSVDLASDLGEALNATKVTFGTEISAQLELLGSTAPKRLALTRTAFSAFATQFSSFAQTIRGNDVTGFIDELTTRGADFASVYNLEVSDALQLFQSGLAGETEPLRRFGLDLSAAAVEAYAYASGIAKGGVDLTEAQKQQARYGLLLQQTAAVQGDATNTAGEYAGQQRRLKVALEETQLALGQALLPAFSGFVSFANDSVVPAIAGIIDKVGPVLGTALTDAGPGFETLLTKVTPLVEKLVEAGAEEGVPSFIEGMNQVVDNAPGWIEALDSINTGFNDFEDDFYAAQQSVSDYFAPARQAVLDFGDSFATFTDDVSQNGEDFRASLGKIDIVGTIAGWTVGLGGQFSKMVAQFLKAGGDVVGGFINGLVANIPKIIVKITGMADNIINTFERIMGIQSPSKVFEQLAVYTAQGYIRGIDKSQTAVNKAVGNLVALPSLYDPTTAGSSGSPTGGFGATGSGNVYIDTVVAPDQNPAVSGRILAAEFVRKKAG